MHTRSIQRFGVPSLVKDDYTGTESARRMWNPLTFSQSLESGLKMMTVGTRGTTKKSKKISVQSFRSRSIHNDVRYRQHLKQHSRTFVLMPSNTYIDIRKICIII